MSSCCLPAGGVGSDTSSGVRGERRQHQGVTSSIFHRCCGANLILNLKQIVTMLFVTVAQKIKVIKPAAQATGGDA